MYSYLTEVINFLGGGEEGGSSGMVGKGFFSYVFVFCLVFQICNNANFVTLCYK